MAELLNCPTCGGLFVKTNLRDVCDKCYKEEEKSFETVYSFIRKRENRTAQMHEVVEATGVSEDLIVKFIRTGRIQLSSFPNLGYPCQKCGKLIRESKLCADCSKDLKKQLSQHEKEEQNLQQIKDRNKLTYYSNKR